MRKGSVGVSRDGPNFLVPPIMSGTHKATNFKFGRYIHSVTAKKPVKNFREKGAWVYPGTSQIFTVLAIISVTRKATKFKFGRYIHGVHANKSPLRIWEKRERWHIQGLPNFLKYRLLSQECVKLWTSNLTSIFRGSMRTNILSFIYTMVNCSLCSVVAATYTGFR